MIGMDGDPTNVHGLQFASNSSAVLHLPILHAGSSVSFDCRYDSPKGGRWKSV